MGRYIDSKGTERTEKGQRQTSYRYYQEMNVLFPHTNENIVSSDDAIYPFSNNVYKTLLKHVFELPVHKHRSANYLYTYTVKAAPLNLLAIRDL